MSDFNMLFTFTVFPIGGGSEVTGPVSQAIERIADSGFDAFGAGCLTSGWPIQTDRPVAQTTVNRSEAAEPC